jgi:hypothetical protein
VRAMREVAQVHGTDAPATGQNRFCATLERRLANLDGSTAAQLGAVLRRMTQARRDEPLLLGAWHGDWTPWNMLHDARGIMVWDWEGFQDDVPIGFDLVHFLVQRAVVLESTDPAEALDAVVDRARPHLAAMGVDPAAAALVVVLYVVHLLAGYLETGERHSRLARTESWLARWLPAVDTVLGDLPPADGARLEPA